LACCQRLLGIDQDMMTTARMQRCGHTARCFDWTGMLPGLVDACHQSGRGALNVESALRLRAGRSGGARSPAINAEIARARNLTSGPALRLSSRATDTWQHRVSAQAGRVGVPDKIPTCVCAGPLYAPDLSQGIPRPEISLWTVRTSPRGVWVPS
jgi:hypothetical protein